MSTSQYAGRGEASTTPRSPQSSVRSPPVVATFSIVARDPRTGDLGVAVASKFLAVGAVVPWAVAGVGAVATQAHANVAFGPEGLRLLREGLGAEAALAQLVAGDPEAAVRQCGIVDAHGHVAAHTGAGCMDWAGHVVGAGFTCQGNILVGPATVEALAAAYRAALDDAPFPARLLAALAAGEAAGGDSRGRQSAAILVVRERGGYGGGNDRWLDLRVDDHPQPVAELRRLLDLHRLYFPDLADVETTPLTGETLAGVAADLRAAGYPPAGDDRAAITAALTRWAGVENLEERLRADGTIDRVVLVHLRDKAGRARGEGD